MSNFIIALHRTLKFEGGYSNDPADFGEETYKGISRHYHPNWEGWETIDRYKSNEDFPFILDKLPMLQALIEELYEEEYWNKILGDKIISQDAANLFFDGCVNPGCVVIKFMQRALNKVRDNILSVDGIMGDETISILNGTNKNEFLPDFTAQRIQFYKEHSDPKFLQGLIARAEAA
jgi:lysozyme family protein